MESFSINSSALAGNGIYPLNPSEAAHLTDLMHDSESLNLETTALRRELRKEDANPKDDFKTIFDMASKDFVIRYDPEYKKSVVVRRHAKVARAVTAADMKQDYSEITAGIVKPDHLHKYASQAAGAPTRSSS